MPSLAYWQPLVRQASDELQVLAPTCCAHCGTMCASYPISMVLSEGGQLNNDPYPSRVIFARRIDRAMNALETNLSCLVERNG